MSSWSADRSGARAPTLRTGSRTSSKYPGPWPRTQSNAIRATLNRMRWGTDSQCNVSCSVAMIMLISANTGDGVRRNHVGLLLPVTDEEFETTAHAQAQQQKAEKNKAWHPVITPTSCLAVCRSRDGSFEKSESAFIKWADFFSAALIPSKVISIKRQTSKDGRYIRIKSAFVRLWASSSRRCLSSDRDLSIFRNIICEEI